MSPAVRQAVENLLIKIAHPGKLISSIELKELNARLSQPLPEWYEELLSQYPLAGMSLQYPLYEPNGGDDGFQPIQMARAQDIYSETEEAYPGFAIKDLGYLCMATDPTGGGDPYFMKVVEGNNPSVYQVYHDVSNVGAEIEANGMVKIANSLAEFFARARQDL